MLLDSVANPIASAPPCPSTVDGGAGTEAARPSRFDLFDDLGQASVEEPVTVVQGGKVAVSGGGWSGEVCTVLEDLGGTVRVDFQGSVFTVEREMLAPDFVRAPKFVGVRAGYQFQAAGARGKGYYRV